jgi:probable HAF family extracellular repeat protein
MQLLKTLVIALLVACAAGGPAQGQACAGDCNGDGRVVIAELTLGIGAALGSQPVASCTAMDTGADGAISVDELMQAVDRAQRGCRFFSAVATLPGWPAGAQARAVTPDGTVLLAGDGERGWRWVDGRRTDLGVLPSSLWTYPVAGSSDGMVIVGATNGGAAEGFRWQDGRIAQFGAQVYPTGISADGTVVAGYRATGRGSNVAFRWHGGTLTDLGFLRPDSHTEAHAMSADGTTVVGFGQYRPSGDDATIDEAFRWRVGALEGLGFLTSGERRYSTAAAVSADGAVVVGSSSTAGGGLQAYRWAGGVMTALGVLPGYAESIGQAVSGDGTVVFGRCQRTEDQEEFFTAFVWDARRGMRELAAVLAGDFGLELGGQALEQVVDVSSDGRTVVGGSVDGSVSSWIARLDRGW